ncbi:MAG: GNAT family N-acetyltransferase [Candidatus Riflebacteria bacterium]|nr:GNAT family N-acetyltransferase [Candidatus Riflebacteria bacterium]
MEFNRENVFADLTKTVEQLVEGMKVEFLRGVKKGINSGITFQEMDLEKSLNVFVEMYYKTMRRVGAEEFYFFKNELFEKLRSGNLSLQLVGAFKENSPVSVALILKSGLSMHYFLGASKEEFLPFRPNNIMFYNMLFWAKEKGARTLLLGGGYNTDSGNSLLRFKKSIVAGRADFLTGKRIWNEKIYSELKNSTLLKKPHLRGRYENFFQIYRL